MLNPKLAIALPCSVDPKTPYVFPFYFLFTCKSNSHNCVVCHFSELSSLVRLLSVRDLWAFLPYPLPLCAQVGFPPTYSHSPFHFLSMHKSSSFWLDSHLPLCAIGAWFSTWICKACANVLQVWQGLILKIERSLNLLVWTFYSSFFFKQRECTTWFFVFAFWCPSSN